LENLVPEHQNEITNLTAVQDIHTGGAKHHAVTLILNTNPVISRSRLVSLWISSIAYSSLTVNSMAMPPPGAVTVPELGALV